MSSALERARQPEYAASAKPPPSVVIRQADDGVQRLDRMLTAEGGTERIADIREEMQSTMEDSAGIFRSGDSLSKGVDQLAELQQRLERVQLSDQTRVFNTELVAALELANMLDIAECILQAALQREESRGINGPTSPPAMTPVSSITRWPTATRTDQSGSSGPQ